MKRLFPLAYALLFCSLVLPPFVVNGAGITKIDQLRRTLAVVPENLNLRYHLGSALLESGAFPEAIVELRKAYPAYSDSKEMNYTLAIAYYQVGDLDSALLYLEVAEDLGATLEPETYSIVNLYYNIGLKQLARASYAEAEQSFLKVLQLGAGRLPVHRSLGDLYNRMGKPDLSLAAFEDYYKSFPEDLQVQQFLYSSYLNRGVAHLNNGDLTQAGLLFDQAIAITSENSLAVYNKGYLAYREGDFAAAAKTLLTVLPSLGEEVRGNAFSLLYNCALELAKEVAALPEALDILRALLAIDSQLEDENYLAGNILMQMERYEEAIGHYERVISLNPAHEGAMLNLLAAQERAVVQLTARARMLQVDYRIDEAQRTIDAALRIDPANKRANLIKGQILGVRDQLINSLLADSEKSLAQGAFLEALQQVRKALQHNPDHGEGRSVEEKIIAALGQEIADRLAQGEALLVDEKIAHATAAFESVLELDPSNAQALARLEKMKSIFQEQAREWAEQGRVALEKGDPVAAISAFKSALKALPGMRVAREGLVSAQLLGEKMVNQKILLAKEALSKGSYREALRLLQLALELGESPLVRKEMEEVQNALASRIAELLKSAAQAAAKDDFRNSANLYRKVLEIDPDNSEAKTRMAALNRSSDSAVSLSLRQAREAMREKNFSRALAAYKKVLDLDSANSEAIQGVREWEEQTAQYIKNLEGRAEEAMAKGDYQNSEKLFKEVLALSPGRSRSVEGLKRLAQIRGESSTPADAERLYLEGITLYTQGRYEEAIFIWKKVQLSNPKHVKAGLNIEKAQRKLQSIKERRDG